MKIKFTNLIVVSIFAFLIMNCGTKYIELPIFAGGSGKYDDKDKSGFKDGIGTEARFWGVDNATIGKEGNLYVTDRARIRKVTPEGKVTSFAGNGEFGFQDGKGTEARFKNPVGIDIDSNENLYVADASNSVIEKINSEGRKTVETIYDSKIRKITSEGEVTTLKIKIQKSPEDKELVDFTFYPKAIAIDKNDYLYIVSYSKIYRIRNGIAEELNYKNGSNIAVDSSNDEIYDIAIDSKNYLYVIHEFSSFYKKITKITPDGELIDFLNNIKPKLNSNNLAETTGIAIDDKDNVYFGDPFVSLPMSDDFAGTSAIYKVSPEGKMTVLINTYLDEDVKLAIDNKNKFLYILNPHKSNISRIKMEENK